MSLLSILVLSLAVGRLRGGRFNTLLQHRWSWPTWPLWAVAIQVVAFLPDESTSLAAKTFAASLHVLSYILLLAFVWANRRTRWMWLVGLGLVANAVAIIANGGFMPVSAEAFGHSAGTASLASGDPYNNIVRMRIGTRLWFLADVFETPDWLLIERTFSIGDLTIAAGTFALVQSLMVLGRRQQIGGAS